MKSPGFWRHRKHSSEDDLAREIKAHLEAESEELEASGMSDVDARYAARRAFGNRTRVQEELHRMNAWNWLESFGQDLRFAGRMLRKAPGFTFVAVAMLALGIAASTAVFSVLDAVLLEPLPFKHSTRLVVIWDREGNAKGESKIFAPYSDYLAYRNSSHTLQDITALTWAVPGQTLTGRGPARDILAIPATLDFFNLVGVPPEFGRTFGPDDLNRECTVVLSHRFWSSELGGDQKIVGQTLRLNDQACLVIGVMPPRFEFYPEQTVLWTLLTPQNELARNPENSAVGSFARLRPGVSLATAQAELTALHHRAHANDRHGKETIARVYPLKEEFTWLASRTLKSSLLVLFAAVAFVLLITCINTANLLLGRSFSRRREMSIRAALGSGRRRLLRQLLTESFLLSLPAALIGTILAYAGLRWFDAAAPVQMPPDAAIGLNGKALAFAAALSILTVTFFGLIPALRTTEVRLDEALKSEGRGNTRASAKKLSKGLVVFELMLSVVLLVAAGLFIQTLNRFGSAPATVASDRMLMYKIGLPPAKVFPDAQRVQFADRLLQSLRRDGEVKSAAITSVEPLRGIGFDVLEIEGRAPPSPGRTRHDVAEVSISREFFATCGIPIRGGRSFNAYDNETGAPVAIVNEALARAYFPNENPLGKHIRLFAAPGGAKQWLTIVGVAANEKRTTVYREMAWVEPPTFYRPWSQAPGNLNLLVSIRTETGAAARAAIRKQIASVNSSVRVEHVETVADLLRHEYLAYPKFRAALLSSFAMLSLLLSIIGLYGVLSQLAVQRTQEIGIRMALGARPSDVRKALMQEGAFLAVEGVAAGVVLSLLLTRFLSSMLYGVRALDPLTLVTVCSVLLLTALAATYIPARRASCLDPIRTLRYE